MSTSQQELLHTQMSAEPPHNSKLNGKTDNGQEDERLIDREKIDGTPFWVEGKEKEYYLRMGRHRLTLEPIESKEAAIEYINYNMYDIILKMIIAVKKDLEDANILAAIEEGKTIKEINTETKTN